MGRLPEETPIGSEWVGIAQWLKHPNTDGKYGFDSGSLQVNSPSASRYNYWLFVIHLTGHDAYILDTPPMTSSTMLKTEIIGVQDSRRDGNAQCSKRRNEKISPSPSKCMKYVF